MKAMEALDLRFAAQQVGRAASGAPLWPEGVTGSTWVHTGIALQPGHGEWNHHRNRMDHVLPLTGVADLRRGLE